MAWYRSPWMKAAPTNPPRRVAGHHRVLYLQPGADLAESLWVSPGRGPDRDHGSGHDRRDCGHYRVRRVPDLFTQLRRRTKKLTLLKSVGATQGQIFALLAWECVYITIGSLILGDVLGVAIAFGVTKALEGVSFFLDGPLVLAGQVCGILAVLLGMLMPPSLKSMHTPPGGGGWRDTNAATYESGPGSARPGAGCVPGTGRGTQAEPQGWRFCACSWWQWN